MVAKHLIQIIITGVQVVGKAFGQAVRQEIRMSQEAAKRSQSRSKFLIHSRKRLDNVLRVGSNKAGIFFVRFQKTQGQPQKNSRPILGKKLNLLEVVKNFNRKTQEIV